MHIETQNWTNEYLLKVIWKAQVNPPTTQLTYESESNLLK